MKLKTKRLMLRDWGKNDIKDLILNLNNINVSRWLFLVPYPYTKKDAEKDIQNCIRRAKKKNRRDYNLAIQLKSKKRIIGEIELICDERHNVAEVDYWLGKKYWGNGYAKEALGKMLDFAFNKLKLRRVEGSIFEGNIASEKIVKKFGFKREGLKRSSCICKADGKIKNTIIYGLLKEELKS
ncbi:GNAT family N-acetyltransferase [Candidatus Pacearchaeota archaeon]|nr:GNAT family N-acetyltransferase [Candidatus Pacearchaeota archaeon]